MGVRTLFKRREGSTGETDRGRPLPRPTSKQHVSLNLNDLTVNFGHLDRETLLKEWEWLIGSFKLPIVLTACGDAFLQDVNDGTVHLLDVGAGTLRQITSSAEEFQSLLSDRRFVTDLFRVELVGALRASGSVLGAGQIYSLKTPPALGGEFLPSNMETAPIELHFSLFGDIFQQLVRLPEGTKIKGFVIEP